MINKYLFMFIILKKLKLEYIKHLTLLIKMSELKHKQKMSLRSKTEGIYNWRKDYEGKTVPKHVLTVAWRKNKNGNIEIGGTVYKHTEKRDHYKRKAHNNTARSRLKKRPQIIDNELKINGEIVLKELKTLLNDRKMSDFKRKLRQITLEIGCSKGKRRS